MLLFQCIFIALINIYLRSLSSKELISFVERHKQVLRKLVELDPLLLLGYLDFMITDPNLSCLNKKPTFLLIF